MASKSQFTGRFFSLLLSLLLSFALFFYLVAKVTTWYLPVCCLVVILVSAIGQQTLRSTSPVQS
ncbi:MAG: hypothetical protein P8X74_17810 [Reinekea sp.]